MIIFVRNIPANSQISELQEYVASAVKRNFFFRSGRVLKSEILVIQDTRTKAYEFHGMVHVDSDRAGARAIQQLKGRRFKNKLVMVREYKFRSWHNDRRLNLDKVSDIVQEKRLTERRRGRNVEIVKDISKIFSSPEDVSRKLL
ncbi:MULTISPECIES: hypothetical protein [Methylomonas]|uniref:RRM domain-containing protein n=2 Tax=Methylomonas TaxID=416 RepID=A0A126T8M8_9GAMM|nr:MULTISPECIES: hypothetical protein [Methylomonas]AMK78421.1 hypothetical protein JT25_018315 [Methylomonas denitrificans]OAI04125.1 hypothetical protein A1342_06240 [Methylomonas methanica]TCV87549.1 hypothetical protein EDE11_10250 [Methylomonas methanica]